MRPGSALPRSITCAPAGALAEAHQPHGAGEALAHGHALLLVDVERVGFDRQVVLQGGLGVDQRLQGVLRVPQALLQGLDGVVHLIYLVNQAAWGRGRGQVSRGHPGYRLPPAEAGSWIPTGHTTLRTTSRCRVAKKAAPVRGSLPPRRLLFPASRI